MIEFPVFFLAVGNTNQFKHGWQLIIQSYTEFSEADTVEEKYSLYESPNLSKVRCIAPTSYK